MQRVRVIHNQGGGLDPVVPFQIRGRSITAMVMRISGPADDAFFRALEEKLGQAPNFFRDAPVVLDLEEVAAGNVRLDIAEFVERLHARRMTTIGVQNGNDDLNEAARAVGLVPFAVGRDAALETQQSRPAPVKLVRRESLLVTEPVRSGQQVFADEGDLIVVAAVSPGAELIADGNIHVYGTLRGRALAGVNGNAAARIFCHCLDAELIAIAGLYKVSDDFDPKVWRQPIQAFLRDEALHVEPLRPSAPTSNRGDSQWQKSS